MRRGDRLGMSRRLVLQAGAAGLASAAVGLPTLAQAQSDAACAARGPNVAHGLSHFGELALGAEQPLPYVAQGAAKGGRLIYQPTSWAFNQGPDTFNTLHGYVLQGDAPPRVELTFDTLMMRNYEEPDAVYGLLVSRVDTGGCEPGVMRFVLRETAAFSDGTPLTSADVAFSYETLKAQGHPNIRSVLRGLESVEAVDDRTFIMRFAPDAARSTPVLAMQLPIFSSAFWQGKDFAASTMEPVMGSGPYRIGDFEQGRYIEYVRRDDYWARDLPIMQGLNNFDIIRVEFFRDRQIGFEAFKKGDLTFREEFTSRTWATEYHFDAVEDGRVQRATLADERASGAQGFFLNLRRPNLQDERVRKALDLAFDFEQANKQLFFGAYTRTTSFFENSPMKAEGLPSDAELALLEPYRDQLSPEVFGEPYLPPVSDGSGRDRRLLGQASKLLDEAGWARGSDRMRRNANGETLTLEFLLDQPAFERIVSPYSNILRAIGIDAQVRMVDSAQYQLRQKSYDFDIITRRYTMASTPGTELRQFFSSSSAAQEGGNNLAGLADPVVDALIETILAATDRESLVIACRALDRVLRAQHFWVPQWYKASHTIAYWQGLERPQAKPRYGFPFETTWWHNGNDSSQ